MQPAKKPSSAVQETEPQTPLHMLNINQEPTIGDYGSNDEWPTEDDIAADEAGARAVIRLTTRYAHELFPDGLPVMPQEGQGEGEHDQNGISDQG